MMRSKHAVLILVQYINTKYGGPYQLRKANMRSLPILVQCIKKGPVSHAKQHSAFIHEKVFLHFVLVLTNTSPLPPHTHLVSVCFSCSVPCVALLFGATVFSAVPPTTPPLAAVPLPLSLPWRVSACVPVCPRDEKKT